MEGANSDILDRLIRDMARRQTRLGVALPSAEQHVRAFLKAARVAYRAAGARYGDTDAGFIFWMAVQPASCSV